MGEIWQSQEGKNKITSVNKNSFSVEIKTESHTITEVTVILPSFFIRKNLVLGSLLL
jgi:hypothetical protein